MCVLTFIKMITVQVYTNLSNDEVTKTFENHLSAGISKILDKPIEVRCCLLVFTCKIGTVWLVFIHDMT